MELHKCVQGTMDSVPDIEENFDNVYLRSNVISVIDNDGRTHWQYDEIVFNVEEYTKIKEYISFADMFQKLKG